MRKNNVVKKAKKAFNKTTKAVGFNALERRRVKKVVKNMAYDVAVNTASTICIDLVYTGVEVASYAALVAYGKVKSLLVKPQPIAVVDEVETVEECAE